MKSRTTFLFAICLFTCTGLLSQDKKIALGLGLNPTISWIKAQSPGMESDGNRMSFSYGLLTDFRFGENYAFESGVFIYNPGGKIRNSYAHDSLNYEVKSSIRMQTINIPLNLRMMTKEIGYLKYYGLFGFSTDWTIKAEADVSVNGAPASQDSDIRTDITPVNVSLCIGGGILYNLSGTTNLMAGISFCNGFLDIFEARRSDGEKLSGRASQIALNLAVLF